MNSYGYRTEIQIVDKSAQAVKEFLLTFYSNEFSSSMLTIEDVMFLAEKYDVQRCIDASGRFLVQSMDIYDICFGYELAMSYNCEHLKSFCEREIRLHTNEVLESIRFLFSELETVSRILEFKSYNCSEYDIFNACFSWAKFKCDHRKRLNNDRTTNFRLWIAPLLHKIRFRSINFDSLSDIIGKHSNLFTREELKELIRMYSSKFEPKILCGERRSSLWDETSKLTLSTGTHIRTKCTPKSSNDRLVFYSNKDFYWGKFNCILF